MLIPKEVILPAADCTTSLRKVWSTSDIDYPRKLQSLIGLVEVVALTHQFQRELDADGRVIANEQDVELARGLMVRLNLMEDQAVFGGNRLEQLRKLWVKSGTKEFTARDAATDLDCDVRKLRRWIEKWDASGFVKCVREAVGSIPATYQLTKKGKDALGLVDGKAPFTSPVEAAA